MNSIDTYGIELIHPRREGRSDRQLGRKGKSNGRRIVGAKWAVLINQRGEIVDWSWILPMPMIIDFVNSRLPTKMRRLRLAISTFASESVILKICTPAKRGMECLVRD